MLITEFCGRREDAIPNRDSTAEMSNPKMTKREMEVLRCLNSGLTNKQIADTLGVSEEEIEESLRGIMKKLHVTRHLKAIVNAVSRGLK